MDIKDVENLAELARLELSMEEKQSLLKDMVGIIEYVKQIEAVELDDVTPVYKLQNAWREDEIIPREFSHDLVVGQFPESKDGFLKVKKIL
jgi:aspartyl-tRNA(Asn)/glutamyl-tRNA(Gln) amidotransferase subunit C